MRTYVYRCDNPRCGARFEVSHPASACDRTYICPVCGSHRTHRIPQTPSVNWGGLAPSRGTMSRTVRRLTDKGAVQRRAEGYMQRHGRGAPRHAARL